jgi:hypothetical protein
MITKEKNSSGTAKVEMPSYAPIAEKYAAWYEDNIPLISSLGKRELSSKQKADSLDKIVRNLLTLQNDIQILTYASFSKQMLSFLPVLEPETNED